MIGSVDVDDRKKRRTGAVADKVLDEGKETRDDDIISDLPSLLIDSILECMPVRDAASTSILSRSWRYIWSELHLHNWRSFIARNGIKLLQEEYFSSVKNDNWPEELKPIRNDDHHTLWIYPSSSGFSNLVTLHFQKIPFEYSSNISAGVIVAPLLESLKFSGCTGIQHVNIHAPKLKLFSATDSLDVRSIRFHRDIINPNLMSLSVVADKPENPRKESGGGGIGRLADLKEFLQNLPRISNLYFDGFFLKLLAAGGTSIIPRRLSVTLSEMKHLVLYKLRFDDVDQMLSALCLLRSCPNMQRLRVSAYDSKNVVEPEYSPSYLEASDRLGQIFNRLKNVHITIIMGSIPELLFIKYVLDNSPLLERMIVQEDRALSKAETIRILDDLGRFKRKSAKARLSYFLSHEDSSNL